MSSSRHSLCRLGRCKRFDKSIRAGYPAENPALRLDHRQSGLVELREIGTAAIAEHDAAIAPVVGFAHRRVDADLGGDAANDQRLDCVILQNQGEIGLEERALAGLVDHRLAGRGIKLGNDLVTGLAANENATHRTRRANAHRRRATFELGARRVR